MSKQEARRELSKTEHNLDEKQKELMEAKNKYKEAIIEDVVSDLLKVQEESGKLTERDLNLFLGNMSLEIIDLYKE